MEVRETRSYDARLAHRCLVRGRDGRSAFKLYRLDLVGRANPERYQWQASGLDPAELQRGLEPLEGARFATSFPHITKVFRFDPGAETVLIVRAFQNRGLRGPGHRASGRLRGVRLSGRSPHRLRRIPIMGEGPDRGTLPGLLEPFSRRGDPRPRQAAPPLATGRRRIGQGSLPGYSRTSRMGLMPSRKQRSFSSSTQSPGTAAKCWDCTWSRIRRTGTSV